MIEHKLQKNSQLFFISLQIVALSLVLYLFSPLLSHIITALILAIATNSINIVTQKRLHFFGSFSRRVTTSFLLSIALFAFIFTPFAYLVSYLFDFLAQIDKNEITNYIQKSYIYIKDTAKEYAFLKPYFESVKSSIDSTAVGKDIAQVAFDKSLSFLKGIGNISYDIAIILFFYFLLNIYGKSIFFYINRRVPLLKENKRLIYSRFFATVASTFFAAIFNIFTQGVAFFLLIIYIDSSLDALSLALLAGFLSIVPFVGNTIVFIPVAVYEIFEQNYIEAIIVVLYSLVVMGFLIDSVLRAFFINFISRVFNYKYRLHELLLIVSIASGIMVFGFWGVIYGPALLALSLAIFDMEKQKLTNKMK